MKRSLQLKYVKLATLAAILMLVNSSIMAQNNQFTYTQYMDNMTPLNSAYSLLDKAGSVNAIARKQWVGIDGAPTTYLFNMDLPLEKFGASTGLTIQNDQFAVEHQTDVNMYFAKSVRLSQKSFLGLSLNAGIRNYVADYSSLDANDQSFHTNVRQLSPNVGFGLLYYTDTYYIGVSVPDLTFNSLGTGSEQSNNNFRNHYFISGAVLIPVARDIAFKPATLITYSRGVPPIADISGTLYLLQTLGIGVNVRTNKEVAGIISISTNRIHLGYSYQFGTGATNLGTMNNATHEVTLSYRFGKGASRRKFL